MDSGPLWDYLCGEQHNKGKNHEHYLFSLVLLRRENNGSKNFRTILAR